MNIIPSIILLLVVVYFAIVFGGAFVVFQKYLLRKKKKDTETVSKEWQEHVKESRRCQSLLEETGIEEVSIRSVDGLTLRGSLCRAKTKTDRIVLLIHGYGADGMSDMSIFAPFYQKQNCHILISDQRCSGKSEGKYYGFGFWERRDIKEWCRYLVNEFGEDSKILLHGWSMGAASALMAVEIGLPRQVRGLVFDCGYSSAIEEFRHVARYAMRIPGFLSESMLSMASSFCKVRAGYPFREAEVLKGIAKVELPILIIHGSEDHFVPAEMGKEIYKACPSKEKELLLIEHAAHCLSYQTEQETYEQAVERLMEHAGM